MCKAPWPAQMRDSAVGSLTRGVRTDGGVIVSITMSAETHVFCNLDVEVEVEPAEVLRWVFRGSKSILPRVWGGW